MEGRAFLDPQPARLQTGFLYRVFRWDVHQEPAACRRAQSPQLQRHLSQTFDRGSN